jgi:hypothetical protein
VVMPHSWGLTRRAVIIAAAARNRPPLRRDRVRQALYARRKAICVSRWRATVTGVVSARMMSGCRPTNSCASLRIRTLRPSARGVGTAPPPPRFRSSSVVPTRRRAGLSGTGTIHINADQAVTDRSLRSVSGRDLERTIGTLSPARRGPDDTNRSVEIAGHGNPIHITSTAGAPSRIGAVTAC